MTQSYPDEAATDAIPRMIDTAGVTASLHGVRHRNCTFRWPE